jgi:hypothetical protein
MVFAEEAHNETYDSYLRMFGWVIRNARLESKNVRTYCGQHRDRMFSVRCDNENEQHMSAFTGCVWPHGDLRRLMSSFLKEARTAGCRVCRAGCAGLSNTC